MSDEKRYSNVEIALHYADGKRGWIQSCYVDGGPSGRCVDAEPYPLPGTIQAHGFEGRSYLERPEKRTFRRTDETDERGRVIYVEVPEHKGADR